MMDRYCFRRFYSLQITFSSFRLVLYLWLFLDPTSFIKNIPFCFLYFISLAIIYELSMSHSFSLLFRYRRIFHWIIVYSQSLILGVNISLFPLQDILRRFQRNENNSSRLFFISFLIDKVYYYLIRYIP